LASKKTKETVEYKTARNRLTIVKTQLEYTEKVIADLKSKILKNEKAIKKSQPEDSMECCYLLSALKELNHLINKDFAPLNTFIDSTFPSGFINREQFILLAALDQSSILDSKTFRNLPNDSKALYRKLMDTEKHFNSQKINSINPAADWLVLISSINGVSLEESRKLWISNFADQNFDFFFFLKYMPFYLYSINKTTMKGQASVFT